MTEFDYSVKPNAGWRGHAKFKSLMDADFFARTISKTTRGGFVVFQGDKAIFSYDRGEILGPEWMNGPYRPNTTSAVVTDETDELLHGDPITLIDRRGKTYQGSIITVSSTPSKDTEA